MGGFLSNLEYELDGVLAWFSISDEMMKVADASKSDVDGFTDMVRSIKGVEVALMIFQQNDTSCRINFRSKGRYIINDIANDLGGGGHAFAAGAVVDGKLSDVSKKVVKVTVASIQKKIKGN
jgi:phosphoesterase RecJ-like protein